MSDGVRLDLNFPDFQKQLFDLDADELRQVVKTLRKVYGLSWEQAYSDHGLKWEEMKSMKGRFTLRVTRRCRAVVTREGEFMRFFALHFDHDSAYGRK
ncbi:MAG: hypothetical protein EXR29_11535 [Betaproteobacteria bacterium]|nr:hypothetical protein [Betaproteobacteria bacterium]